MTPPSTSQTSSTTAPTSPTALNEHLSEHLLPRVTPFLQKLRADERERQFAAKLHDEQDAAFRAAAERDRERLLAAQEADAARRRAAEEIEMQRLEAQARREREEAERRRKEEKAKRREEKARRKAEKAGAKESSESEVEAPKPAVVRAPYVLFLAHIVLGQYFDYLSTSTDHARTAPDTSA